MKRHAFLIALTVVVMIPAAAGIMTTTVRAIKNAWRFIASYKSTNPKSQISNLKYLEPPIKPLRHRILPLIHYKAEEISAGGFDRSLRIENLVAPGLAGVNHDDDTVNA